MRRSLVLFLIGLFLVGISGQAWAEVNAPTARNVECNECVNDTDIATGAVTSGKIPDGAVATSKIADGAVTINKLADWSVNGSKIVDFSITDTKISSNAVTTPKIVDGSVTDAKITGPISGSKLGSHSHDGSDIIDGTITTSKIGDGTITDAKITGPISTTKLNVGTTSDTVATGDHNHDAVYQKKYANVIVVAKSGGDFTSIQAAIDSINPTAENPYLIKVMPGTYVESITMKSYVHLQGAGRNVTTIVSADVDMMDVIRIQNLTSVTISGLAITLGPIGIIITSSSSVTVTDNQFSGSGGYYGTGVYTTNSSSIVITGNIFTGYQYGISNYSSSPIISGNIINNNTFSGILIISGSPVITYNKITGNSRADITTWSCTTSNVSFNVYDNLYLEYGGCSPVGMYNVKSNGTPW